MTGFAPPLLETIALLGDLLAGVAFACLLTGKANPCPRFAILPGLGLGMLFATGITFLEWLWFGQRALPVIGFEIALGVASGFHLRKSSWAAPNRPRATGMPYLLLAVLAVTGVFAVLAMVRHVQELPHGDYDAIAIWNKRARSLFYARERFAEVLDGQLAMPQSCYPLLVPGMVERLWRCAGREWALAPVLVGVLAWLGIVVGVATTIARSKSLELACVAATVLVGTPFLARNAVDQYADVPVGAFYVLAMCCVARGHLGLAGACAGAAAWTKNEGLLFVCAFVAALLLAHPPRVATLIRVGLGLVVPLALVLAFKLRARVGDEYMDRTLAQTLRMLLDPERAWLVLREYAKELWALGGGLFAGLTAIALWLTARPWPLASRVAAATCGITLLGLFVVLVRTPYDLAYDLATTKSRSMIQLWPSWVFALLLAVRDPWGRTPTADARA